MSMKSLQEMNREHGRPDSVLLVDCYVSDRDKSGVVQTCIRFSRALRERIGWKSGVRIMPFVGDGKIEFRLDPNARWRLRASPDSQYTFLAFKRESWSPIPEYGGPRELRVVSVDTTTRTLAVDLPPAR